MMVDTTEETKTLKTEKASKTGFSMYRPKQDTKERLDQIGRETESRIDDDTLRRLCDEHYELKQIKDLVGGGGVLTSLIGLLTTARNESELPVGYLLQLLADKRAFKASYEKRHANKDYSGMGLSELRDTKTTEAARERFARAVAAIMAYNDAVGEDSRWYINAKTVTDLVGGKPGIAETYLKEEKQKQEIGEHHTKHGLTVNYNRRPKSIVYRVAVPERPGEPGDLQKQIADHEAREKARLAARAARAAQESDESETEE